MEKREIKVWKISVGGTSNKKFHQKAFEDKILYIGFTQIEEKEYPFNDEGNPQKSENQIALLQHEVQIGDFVLVPRTNLHASFLAKITSSYYCVTTDDESTDFPRRFAIEPISGFGEFKLSHLIGKKQWQNSTVEQLTFPNIEDLYSDFNMKPEKYQLSFYNDFTKKLLSSHNLILRGAPGTGKTYLAREIAEELTGGNEDQIGFVQFHPSYDYTDFVEGLRPVSTDDGQLGFKLQDGIFRKFCEKAKNASKSGGRDNFNEAWNRYLEYVNDKNEKERLTEFSYLTVNSRQNFNVNYDSKAQGTVLTKSYVYELYKDDAYAQQTYYRGQGRKILQTLKEKFGLLSYQAPTKIDTSQNFVFIIDEINRGEISKIFGELFFSIDPGYRGEKGKVTTQYANMREREKEFYIPENVYIIGTMNDIDRSVDTFDFAMRRRFRFVEVTAESQIHILDELGDVAEEAKSRLRNLNQAISEVEGLNSHYHIGPSYFLKLQDLDGDFDVLWSDYLEPLLEDYLRGSYDEVDSLNQLKAAYNAIVDNHEESADEG